MAGIRTVADGCLIVPIESLSPMARFKLHEWPMYLEKARMYMPARGAKKLNLDELAGDWGSETRHDEARYDWAA